MPWPLRAATPLELDPFLEYQRQISKALLG